MKTYFTTSFALMILVYSHSINSQEIHDYLRDIPSLRTIDECNQIVNVAEELKLGFPFNDTTRLRYNGFSYIIGKEIQNLKQSNLIEKENRASTLHNVINLNWKRGKNYPIEGMNNFAALQEVEKDIDVASLLAAFVIARDNGDISDVVPFLEFVNVYFGSNSEALPGVFVSSMAEEHFNSKLTHEQRRAFWPAEQAILKHPNVTVPLLLEALKNKALHQVLRLRAAAFLVKLDRPILDEALSNLDDWLVEKIHCLIEAEGSWNGVNEHICENLQRYKDHMASQQQ